MLYRLAALQLVLLGCLPAPSLLAQRREDILSIQRDVAQLQDQVKQLQAGQDQKIATLENLIRQALDESSKVSSAAAAQFRKILTVYPAVSSRTLNSF